MRGPSLRGTTPRGTKVPPQLCRPQGAEVFGGSPLAQRGGGAQLVLTPRTPDTQETLLSGCARRVDCVYPVQATY